MIYCRIEPDYPISPSRDLFSVTDTLCIVKLRKRWVPPVRASVQPACNKFLYNWSPRWSKRPFWKPQKGGTMGAENEENKFRSHIVRGCQGLKEVPCIHRRILSDRLVCVFAVCTSRFFSFIMLRTKGWNGTALIYYHVIILIRHNDCSCVVV